MVSAKTLLGNLPPFTDTWVTVKKDQRVRDIIKQILVAHEKYAGYYDKIALYFDAPTIEGICEKLYKFIKAEIKYKEEPGHDQTTALPTGILTRGYGDCKHYASFCGGVLDALQRLTGREIDWCYRFSSYEILSAFDLMFGKKALPHHVFVAVFDGDTEFWIDPVPGANSLEPLWFLDKKISTMPLRDNIGSVYSEDKIGAPLQLPDYVDLLAGSFQLVQNESDIADNNKVIAIAKADFDQYTPRLGHDQDLTTFLWWIKLSTMARFGVLIRPLWDGGGKFLSDKWQYEFAPWFKQYYPKEWQLYLDAWEEYRQYSFGVITDKWIPIINKGMSIVDTLFKQFTGISLTIPQLPTDPLPTTPLPNYNTVGNNLVIISALAGVITYAVTKKITIAGAVGIGTYFLIDRMNKETTPPVSTTPTTPLPSTSTPTIKLPPIDWSSLFPSSNSNDGSSNEEVFI